MGKDRSKLITIGILPGWQAYTGTLDTFLYNVFRGIQAAGVEQNVNFLFCCSFGENLGLGLGRTAWPIHTEGVDYIPIGPWNCDGLIIIPPISSEIGLSYFQGLYDSDYPIVFAGSGSIGSGVVADNEDGIRQAFHHLVQHGHRRIAFVSGREHEVDSDSAARQNAYQTLFNEYGLEYNPDLVESGQHSYRGGYEAIRKILAKKIKFSAVIASNDQSAIGAIDSLRDHGYQIPEDVAIIGFDNRTESKTVVPQLTTIRFPMYEVGYQSANHLIRWIRRGDKPKTKIRIPTFLVIRESCGCTPGITDNNLPFIQNSTYGASLPEELDTIDKVEKAITDVAFSEITTLSYQEVKNQCKLLIESLTTYITKFDSALLYRTIKQIIDQANAQDEDVYAWQKAVSFLWLHKETILKICHLENHTNLTQKFFDLARLLISEVGRGNSAREQLQTELLAAHLGQMTTLFLSAKDESQILSALQFILPNIGIKSAIIGIYEADGKENTSYTRLFASDQDLQSIGSNISTKIRSKDFPLQNSNQSDLRTTYVVLPLRIQNTLLGFVAFTTSNFGPVSLIARQIAAAWHSVKLFTEVTEARALAEERRKSAEEANHLKSRLLSVVSHELRTPINLIAGLTDVILRENSPDVEFTHIDRQDLERINISAQHLDGLIRDVLDLARLDIGQLRLTCERVEIIDILQSANIIGKQMAEDKNLTWYYDVQPDLSTVWGDKTRLRQVILNLVNNAVKFTAQGEVVLAAYEKKGKVFISIRDTGLGIPIYDQQYIFDEFRQSERSSARGFGGLGLGLSICKRLVEMHGGEIGVSSDGIEGNGSCFTFSLPVMDETRDRKSLPESVSFSYGNHILALVNHENEGQLLQKHLGSKGFRVDVCLIQENSNWFSAVTVLPPDFILLDLDLASDQGWEVLQTLKNNPSTKDISVLFFTLKEKEGFGSILDFDFATKPLTYKTLSQVLEKSNPLDSKKIGNEKSILIVDDDPGILELHTRLINNISPMYKVYRALNGHSALQIIHNYPIDLVILDLFMPELDGFSVLQTMRNEEISRNIPVIVVTGQNLTEDDIKRLNLGMTTVLSKGIYTVQETLEHIVKALEHKKPQRLDVQQRMLRAITFIHQNYAEPLSREVIARYLGLSQRHFDRCFKQELGVSPMVYLNRYRIKKAKILLESGNKDITKIAMDVGFTSSSYFTRVFREEVGVSPRSYTKS